MMSELWLWRQCDFILVFYVQAVEKLVLQTVLLFAKDLKTGLVKIYGFCWKSNVLR